MASLVVELVLPSSVEAQWGVVERELTPLIDGSAGAHELDAALSALAAAKRDPDAPRVPECAFFKTIPGSSEDPGTFDWVRFFARGLPFMARVALDMPRLFADTALPVWKMRSSWEMASGAGELGTQTLTLSRTQCACLLAHSFFGSLRRPASVQPNDFRFTAVDLFVGTAASPNSAMTFLNYFSVASGGMPGGDVTYERVGYRRGGAAPWSWTKSTRPLCKAKLVDGTINECRADVHSEFANAYVGGGVLSGDAAMEETLFLVKPELMVAMALNGRMVDREVIAVSGAIQYSCTDGFGQSFTFAGDYAGRRAGPPPRVVAIDAIRGGGPAMTKRAMLRDMNKARIAFHGAREVATGHWGCGAYGNNHNLMFVKQWLAASDAGASCMYYHDFSRKQSHHIAPLIRKLKHLTVGEAWRFLLDLSSDLVPCQMGKFYTKICAIATGKLVVPGAAAASAAKKEKHAAAAAKKKKLKKKHKKSATLTARQRAASSETLAVAVALPPTPTAPPTLV